MRSERVVRFRRHHSQMLLLVVLSGVFGATTGPVLRAVKFEPFNDEFSARRHDLLIVESVLLLLDLDIRGIRAPSMRRHGATT